MKKILITLGIIALYAFSSNAQNLVIDGGFEDWDGTQGNGMDPLIFWESSNGSPDHHHVTNQGNTLTMADTTCNVVGNGGNGCGAPFAGQGCLGFWTSAAQGGTREWATTRLNAPLEPKQCYTISFYVQAKKNRPGSEMFLDNIGVLFSGSSNPGFDPNTVDYNTVAQHYVATDSVISGTNWHYIELDFTSDRYYFYAHIGVMGNYNDIQKVYWSTDGSVGPYYWLDELSIVKKASCCELELENITSTGSDCGLDNGSIQAAIPDTNQYTYRIYDADSNYIGSNTTGQFDNLSEGGYLIRVQGQGCTAWSPLIEVEQLGAPDYQISASNPFSCGGNSGSITFSDLTPNTSYDIEYTGPNGAVGPLQITSTTLGTYTIANLTAGQYTNIFVTETGCKVALSDQQLQDPTNLNLTVTLIPALQCGDTAFLRFSGLNPSETYDYTFDQNYAGTSTSNSFGEFDVTVGTETYTNFEVIESSTNCKSFSIDTITSVPIDSIVAMGRANEPIDCRSDGSITLGASPNNGPYNIYWPGGDTLNASLSSSGVITLPFSVGSWGPFIIENATTLCQTTIGPFTVEWPQDESLDSITVTPESCLGKNDGEIFVLHWGHLVYDLYIDSVRMSDVRVDSLPPGSYTITLVNNQSGCSLSEVVEVLPGELCCEMELSIGNTIAPNCDFSDGSVSIDITNGNGGEQYSTDKVIWDTVAVVGGLPEGAHTIFVQDQYGCEDSIDVSLTAIRPIAPVISGDSLKCLNDSLTLLSDIANSDWYDEDNNLVHSGIQLDLVFDTPGRYNYLVYNVDNASGCSSLATPFSVYIPEPLFLASTDTLDYCYGESYSIIPDASEEIDWGGITAPSFDGVATQDTVITLTISNHCGTQVNTINIVVNPIPSIDAGSDQTIMRGELATLNASGGDEYEWSLVSNQTNTDYLNCRTCESPSGYVLFTSTYALEGWNEFGCSATDTVVINVDGMMNVFIPNIFSPNNDGQNDRFMIRGPEFHTFEIRVFNRWGEEVYQSFDANEGWDGQFRGQQAAPGVYTYYVDGKAVTGEIINKSGNVTLVR